MKGVCIPALRPQQPPWPPGPPFGSPVVPTPPPAPPGARLPRASLLVLQAGQALDVLLDLRGRKSHSVSADFLIQSNLFTSKLRTA